MSLFKPSSAPEALSGGSVCVSFLFFIICFWPSAAVARDSDDCEGVGGVVLVVAW